MKFEVWVFIENWRVEFKIWALRIWIWKFGNKNFELKIWDLGYIENFKKDSFFFFFFFVCWLSLRLSLSVGAEFWPPTFLCLSLFSFFFFHLSPPLFLHYHYSLSSSPWIFFFISPFLLTKKYFSKLLKLPSSISINISSDPCVLKDFIMCPFLVKPIFQNSFSLHQNGFFLQEIFLSNFSW